MSKRAFIIFGVFVVAIGVLLPLWATGREGEAGDETERVPAGLQASKEMFDANCGVCHTLEKAGSDGIVGPNLDILLGAGGGPGNEQRVLIAIQNGISGRMPKGILQGEDAKMVAKFVAQVAGQ